MSPSAFLRTLGRSDGRWGDGSQQDAQEFLHALLEALQSECNQVVGKPAYKELSGKGSEAAQAHEAETYARCVRVCGRRLREWRRRSNQDLECAFAVQWRLGQGEV